MACSVCSVQAATDSQPMKTFFLVNLWPGCWAARAAGYADVHLLWVEVMQEGAEGQAVPPGRAEVGDLHPLVAAGDVLAPLQQRLAGVHQALGGQSKMKINKLGLCVYVWCIYIFSVPQLCRPSHQPLLWLAGLNLRTSPLESLPLVTLGVEMTSSHSDDEERKRPTFGLWVYEKKPKNVGFRAGLKLVLRDIDGGDLARERETCELWC